MQLATTHVALLKKAYTRDSSHGENCHREEILRLLGEVKT
jgi:hypothetical protein